MKKPSAPPVLVVLVLLLIQALQIQAGTFVLSSNSTTAQTLGSGSGQTGTVNAGVSLTVNGSTIAVTISGNNATLTNLGTISQTGTGRVIRDNTGVTGLVINNGSTTNSAALMQAADADVIQMNKANGSVALNNYGTMTSLNASAGGSQAVDFNAITTGANTVNNYATGVMQASEADAVRPGVNGFVNNDGLIKATTTAGSSSDGIDAQTNSGITIVNAASAGAGTGTGTVEGGRHGITGGAVIPSLGGDGTFTISVTNNLGGTIQGDNGSGINIDGFNNKELVTIVNHGLITGKGVTGDGDGVDVDGLVNLTNYGTIKSLSSFNDTSEGVTVGGGTIINSGTIQGSIDPSGGNTGTGRGITIAGIDKNPDTDAAIPIQAPYAATSITNSGLIKGDSDSGIAFTSGLASGFSHTITNQTGGTIQSGGATAPAVLLAADNTTINNSGTIDGSSSGKAITGGSGSLTLHITGGSASILGDINGGSSGTSAMTISPGTGNSFGYAGSISNFNSVDVQSGTVSLSGASTYSGATTVSGGTLSVINTSGSATGNGLVAITGTGTLRGTGNIGGDVTVQSGGIVAPGLSPGTLGIGGNLNITGGSHFQFELGFTSDLINIGSALNFIGSGETLFDIFNNGMVDGADYTLMNFASVSGLSLSNLGFGTTPGGFLGEFNINATSLTLHVDSAPEPSRAMLLGAGLAGLLLRRRRV